MDCLELSIRDLEDESYYWAQRIKREYNPDTVVYVAKAGYLIGNILSNVFDASLIGISTERRGNNFKNMLSPILKLIPNSVRFFLIKMELKSNIHKVNEERKIEFISDLSYIDKKRVKKILIVDDSVDTGYSMKAVKETVYNEFENAEVRTASLNVWDKSMEVIDIDYALYRNTIIKAPMSKDSKEYSSFVSQYEESLKKSAGF